jgi:cytochrome b6-f complex iron-sulfur subunit
MGGWSETMSFGEQKQTRRHFCTHTCRAAAVAALGGTLATLLESCGGGSSPTSPGGGGAAYLPIVSGTASGSTITVTVTGTPLATAGTLALVRTSAGEVLVARTGADTFMALSATCTHQACEITAYSGQDFLCPCHGSQFDTSGQVVQGPAFVPLPQFHTQWANDVLTITA